MTNTLTIKPIIFQKKILEWFDQHGRKHLPWQDNKTPYRVWLSEIMLQQTQVSTVIPYFERFIQRFPDIEALANAQEDDVLHLWTGLGYYSRARNLHRSAKIICHDFAAQFPHTFDDIIKLPGIGRSTAGAILSIAFQKQAAILDGNVKRVLTRFYGVTDWPGDKSALIFLWDAAEKLTPKKRTADYSQAMMDLGATICIRGKPLCIQCPLAKNCLAYSQGIEKTLPRSKPKKNIPVRQATFLLIQHEDRTLLTKRPPTGIWGGLWSPPDIIGHQTMSHIKQHCRKHFSFSPKKIKLGNIFRHTFSHFHLDILPAFILTDHVEIKVMDSEQQIWYNMNNSQAIGLPAPVKKLLGDLKNDSSS